jgi:hypothetical protein
MLNVWVYMVRRTLRSVDIAPLVGSTDRNFALVKSKKDPTFPPPLPRSKIANGAILWYEDEVLEWAEQYQIKNHTNSNSYYDSVVTDKKQVKFNIMVSKALVEMTKKRVYTKDKLLRMCNSSPYFSKYYADLIPKCYKLIKIRYNTRY